MTKAPNAPLAADACTTMEEVRAGVDALDLALVGLIAERFGYMRAAARIKADRASVRDEARKADVLAKVDVHGRALGLPDGLAPTLWDPLIEASIAYELAHFDARKMTG